VYLDSRSDRDLFQEENLGALASLAALAMLSIENARRYDSAWRALEELKDRNEMRKGALIGASSAMQELYSMIDRIAKTELPVFIEGESGTGKELVAREIHHVSSRA
jgi:DNA-binding NtrC family response regulator